MHHSASSIIISFNYSATVLNSFKVRQSSGCIFARCGLMLKGKIPFHSASCSALLLYGNIRDRIINVLVVVLLAPRFTVF